MNKRLAILGAGLAAALSANLIADAITGAGAEPAPVVKTQIQIPAELAAYGPPLPGTKGNPWTGLVQWWLRDRGFRPGPVDRHYGPMTEDAVRRFQTAAGVTVDGVWGQETALAQMTWTGQPAPDPQPAPATESVSGLPCPEYHGLLAQYGLDVDRFARIMWRESRCDPGAVNRSSGARGLVQVMPQWTTRWGLCSAGIACSPDELLDPETNIRAARFIFDRQGWQAWSQTA